MTPVKDAISLVGKEVIAKELLAQGKFRKARDEFKLLCKADKPKYLPFLIDANKGLAKEMLLKGLKSDADQVINYLKTLVPPAQWKTIELEFAASRGLDSDSNSASTALTLLISRTTMGEPQRLQMADIIVMSWQEKDAAMPGSEPFCRDALAIQKALESISTRDFEAVHNHLRPLGQSSVFAHWKLFAKGLAAFHAGDFQKANRFFNALPTGTVPSKASKPYSLLCNLPDHDISVRNWTASDIQSVLDLIGEGSIKEPLLEAEKHWKRGDHESAYEHLRKKIPSFPSEENTCVGALSDFCLNTLGQMPPDDSESLMEFYSNYVDYEGCKSPIERMMLLKVLVVFAYLDTETDCIQEYWDKFMSLYEQIHGKNPRWSSEAYLSIGQFFIRQAQRYRMRRRNDPRPIELALETLTKSIELNPDNLQACLVLCSLFKDLKKKSELNKLRDRMTVRFSG